MDKLVLALWMRVLLWVTVLLLPNVLSADNNALPPTPTEVTPGKCALSPSTEFWQRRVEWSSDTGAGGFSPKSINSAYLSGADPFTYGSGISVANVNSITEISGVNQSNYADAYIDGDYIEYTFRTAASLGDTAVLSGLSENGGRNGGDNYKMDLLLSDDGFTTAVRLISGYSVDDTITGGATDQFSWIYDGLAQVYLEANTEYKLRAVMYNAVEVGGIVTMDDFAVSVDYCGDMGDAPYSTGGANGGTHLLPEIRTHYIGSVSPDAEHYANSDDNTAGDVTTDEESGVTLPTFKQGDTATVTVPVTGAGGLLNAWIDWDNNEVFDADEKIASDVTLAGGAASGTISLNVTVPGDAAIGSSYARFRWSPNTVSNPTDDVEGGELEDYAITVEAALSSTNSIYTPQSSCAAAGYIETFGSGVGRSPLPAGVTNYTYESVLQVQDGKYALVDQSSIAGAGSWWIVDDDHTPNDTNGKMLLVNASDVQGASAEFYRQNLTGLEVGKQYALSAYIANADNSTAAVRIHPNVKLSVESGAVITSIDTGEILRDPGGDELAWKEYRFLFTATQTNINIVLSNAGIGGSGNDLVIDDISVYEFCQDYGDAPVTGTSPNGSSTNNYGVASHAIVSGTYLGSSDPDADSANQPSADAGFDGTTGDDDDVNGTDDEDGISAFPTLTTGDTTYTIPAENITTVGIGTLHAWIDFDGNGVFDADEHSSPTTSGGALSWTMDGIGGNPTFTLAGKATFARFRFTSDTAVTASTPASIASDGEVEDYTVSIITNDYGDAPGYGDAYHAINGAVFLGNAPDAEAATKTTNGDASDDVNDDGVFTNAGLSTSLQGASMNLEDSITLHIPVTGAGNLSAWIDWNGDGNFTGNDEQIANAVAGTDQTLAVVVNVPLGATLGTTYARFRFSSDVAATNPTGEASNGEVEDYQITITNTPTAPSATSIAYCSNTWTLDGGVYKSTTAQGVEITASASAASGASWSFAPNDAFNDAGTYSLPALSGTSSLSTVFSWDTTPEDGRTANAATDAATGTLTFGFGVPVKNPVIHIDRQGGYGSSAAETPQGLSNSSVITPNAANASATFTRLAGTTHFEVTSNSIQRTPNETMQNTGATGLSGTDSSIYTAMGSVQVNGTYNSLSLDFSGVGVEGAGGDGIEFIVCAETYDYGDAPDTYATYESSGGPQHDVINGVYLGTVRPDTESEGQPSGTAANDGADEDAVSSLPVLTTSDRTYSTTVKASNDTSDPATLIAWIDFDGNGTFDADEAAIRTVEAGSNQTNYTLNWSNIPADIAEGSTYLRLRLTTDSLNNREPGGAKTDGEVEDHPIRITTAGVTVSGRVFRDVNVNAANDSGEVGVTQLPVVLYDTVNDTCVSTRTDGNGDYVFEDVTPGTYQVYEASRQKVPVPADCGPAFAKNPASYRSTTADVRDAFTVNTTNISDQDFGEVKPPVFEPDNSGQVLPGNVLFYAHRFTTPTKGSVSFSSVSSGNTSSGWSSILYRDANCDGVLNGSEGAAPLANPIATSAASSVCLINKVYAPSNVAANDTYIQTITAAFDYENTYAGTQSLVVRDVTTSQQVQAPTLPATPEVVATPAVPAQPEQPATPATPYIPETDPEPAQAPVAATPVVEELGPSRLELRKTVRNITKNSAETATVSMAEPGDTLEYRIYYSNTGTGPITDLVVNDTVPPYTALLGSSSCGTEPNGMSCTASPLGLDDSLKWVFSGTLTGGSGSSVSYQVKIDE